MKIRIGTKYNLFHMINFGTMVIYQLVHCKSLHRQLWSSPVFWTSRSCNMLADGLAKLGHTLGDRPCFMFFDSCPPQVEELLLQDNIM